MSISGKVESKSRPGTGIKVDGVWYNGTTAQLDFIAWTGSGFNPPNITFEADAKKKITSIEAAEGSAAPTGAAKGVTFDKRQEVIVYQSGRNAAQVMVKDLVELGLVSLPTKKEEKYDAYCALVAEHTIKFHNAAMAVYTGSDVEEVT